MSNTVRDLIALLATMPPDAIVELEGCDCTGQWCGTADDTAAVDAVPERFEEVPPSPAMPAVLPYVSKITGKLIDGRDAISERAGRSRRIAARPALPAIVLLKRRQ